MKNQNSTHSSCRFCNLIASRNSASLADQILVENEDYYAVSSIGGFIPGWTLIFSKRHQLNLASDYTNASFVTFINFVKNKVTEEYGTCVIFEHGSNVEDSATSCGVSHAHLHIVPFSENLELLSQLEAPNLAWQPADIKEVSGLSNHQEYLFCSTKFSLDQTLGLFTVLPMPQSQFFRHVLAKSQGLTEFYDYKKYRFEEISIDTALRLSKNFLLPAAA